MSSFSQIQSNPTKKELLLGATPEKQTAGCETAVRNTIRSVLLPERFSNSCLAPSAPDSTGFSRVPPPPVSHYGSRGHLWY